MSLADLGRRAVACKHWRWMPGMLLQWRTSSGVVYRGRVCNIEEPDAVWCEGREDRFDWPELPKCWPDLSDPATLGCLLALVREAWGSDEWSRSVVPVFNGIDAWTVGCLDMQGRKAPRLLFLVNKINCMPVGIGSSEAGALVIALEAAP